MRTLSNDSPVIQGNLLERHYLIKEVADEIHKTQGNHIVIKVCNRKIEFWPLSDTYYLHSKGVYGAGILALCAEIKAWKQKVEENPFFEINA